MTKLPRPQPVDKALALADDTEFAIELSNLVFYREAAIGFAKLTEAERTAFMVDQLEREVNNGGFAQFFLNSSGDHAAETPMALRAIGAAQMARIVEEALAPFGRAGPSRDTTTRSEQIEALGEAAEDVWSTCDSKFYEYPDNLAAQLRGYVAARQQEFGPPIPPDPQLFR
jgi:uncharacterized protein DUF4375